VTVEGLVTCCLVTVEGLVTCCLSRVCRFLDTTLSDRLMPLQHYDDGPLLAEVSILKRPESHFPGIRIDFIMRWFT